jgi:hypothetical protein
MGRYNPASGCETSPFGGLGWRIAKFKQNFYTVVSSYFLSA